VTGFGCRPTPTCQWAPVPASESRQRAKPPGVAKLGLEPLVLIGDLGQLFAAVDHLDHECRPYLRHRGHQPRDFVRDCCDPLSGGSAAVAHRRSHHHLVQCRHLGRAPRCHLQGRFALQQTVEAIIDACDVRGPIKLEVRYDQFVIDAIVTYVGAPLELPRRGLAGDGHR
jgi:hypothetical protein